MRFKQLLILIVCMIGLQTGNAQTLKAYLKAAEEATDNRDFYSALVWYQEALEFEEDNTEFQWKAAESARQINGLTLAEQYYKAVVEKDTINTYPDAMYRLAEVQQELGKYDTAQLNYQLYLSEHEGENPYFTERAQFESRSCEYAMEMLENPWFEYDIRRLPDGINSVYTDFGATEYKDTLYFSSLRFENEDDDYIPTRPEAGLLIATDSTVAKMDNSFNVEGSSTANGAFNKNRDRFYFTVCDYDAGGDDIRCELYYRDLSSEGWGDAIRMDTSFNVDTFTTTQPNVGIDPVTGNEVLYFVTNRPGGYGGLDIWMAEITEDGFGVPINLDSVNTTEDDVTPFYHHPTNTLYFSSNGRVGMGGFDVFSSQGTMEGFKDCVHLGYPLNTSYDEVYFVLDDTGKSGHISSNRPGSLFLDAKTEACCFDIYKVNILPFADLIVQTFDAATLDSLYDTEVVLVDMAEPDSLWELRSYDAKATDTWGVERAKEYMVYATKPGYLPDTLMFNTFNVKDTNDIIKKLFLQSEEVMMDIFVFDCDNMGPLRGATVNVIDVEDPATAFIATNDASNDFHFPVQRGRTYRIITSRKGYDPKTVIINTGDFPGGQNIVRNICLDPCSDVACYLPLVLYFDNNQPNPGSWNRTTNKTYSMTYPLYYARKSKFMDIFADILNQEDSKPETQLLDNFFETEVKKGKEDLDNFLENVERILNDGGEIAIGLKGYTSPIASEEYNLRLGYRRANAVYNEFVAYKDGILEPYLKQGALKIEIESFGETNAPSDVSDSLNDLKKSIYSLNASKERRVEIVSVKVKENSDSE